VIKYDKKRYDSGLKYVEAGVLVLRREVLTSIEKGHTLSLENGLYPALIQQRQLAAYITEQRFYDIGTPEQRLAFEKLVKGRVE